MNLNRTAKLIAIAVFTVGIASISLAQSAGPTGGKLTENKHPQGGNRQPIIEALAKLNLTQEQKTKIQALVKARNEDLKAFRQAHQGDQAANRTHATEAQKTFLEGIKAVLTPAQWDQFQTELKAMRQKGGPNKQGASNGGGAPPPPIKSNG